jgi:hypothetical protein
MGGVRALVGLGVVCVALYGALLHSARSTCAAARGLHTRNLAAITGAVRREFSACAWDAQDARACSIPSSASRATTAAPSATDASLSVTLVHESAWCAVVGALPDPVPWLPGAHAAAVVDLVISRDRLQAFEYTLQAFRRQCDCGWVWPFRTPANYDYKVTYEFVRTGLRGDALLDELRRAAEFYDRFGGALETWVSSVRALRDTQIMSDHGMLYRDTTRHTSVIVRYILVVYTPFAAGDASAFGAAFWLPGSGDGAGGTFTVAMSEVQITTWPAADCDCAHDHSLQQRLRESIDARMKKYFADTAAHVIRERLDTADAPVTVAPPPVPHQEANVTGKRIP